MGVVTTQTLAKNRKYAILGAFIVSAVLTPTPDVFNQTLMAGPLILLYEVGILSARLFGRRPTKPAPGSSNGQPPSEAPASAPASPVDQATRQP
jgi:sec-independent protein translocase protein TatC